MSKFDVKVRKIRALDVIPKADRVEIARIEDYLTVVRKGEFKVGDLVVYIPESAILPEFVLKNVGLWDSDANKGRCGGELGNRVHAAKLCGIISQGIAYPLSYLTDHPYGEGWYLQDDDTGLWKVSEGEDVGGLLQLTKHVPEVPAELLGAVMSASRHLFPNFDIEDIKKYPDMIEEGVEVVFTEKTHGICTEVIQVPEADAIEGQNFFVTSKGLGSDGMAFIDVDENKNNPYLKMAYQHALRAKLKIIAERLGIVDVPVFLLGETFGFGIQDLNYGVPTSYRAFGIGYGYRNREIYVDHKVARALAEELDIPWMPVLYEGPFSKEVLKQYTSGREAVSGKEVNIREGVIVELAKNQYSDEIGRIVLKSVSPEYLTRKGKKTEYQ